MSLHGFMQRFYSHAHFHSSFPYAMSVTAPDISSAGSHAAFERLSWGRCLLNCATNGALEVVADKRDFCYNLYQDCVLYLRAEYPPKSFTCSLPNDIGKRGLGHLPPAFGTLVNLLADRYLFTPQRLEGDFSDIFLDDSSVLDFIFRGILSPVGPLKTQSHAACALRTSPERTTEADLYQALFLDCITDLWTHESFLRAHATVWSPMPWSRRSVWELSKTYTGHGQAMIALLSAITNTQNALKQTHINSSLIFSVTETSRRKTTPTYTLHGGGSGRPWISLGLMLPTTAICSVPLYRAIPTSAVPAPPTVCTPMPPSGSAP